MLLDRFLINVLIRVGFILLTSIVLGIVLQHIDRGYYYTLSGMIFLIMLQAWLLVNQVNKTNRDLEKFFSSVHDHDSSVMLSDDSGNSSFRKLHDGMNNLFAIIQNVKIENERTNQFLQSVVDLVDIGLLSYDKKGNIEIYNRAAKRYLNVQNISQLSFLIAHNEELFIVINTIKPGQDVVHKIQVDSIIQNVLIKATELKIENNSIKLVSFQDITNELDKKEMDSWQKIIRVLTHEIMNSISPITSLTRVISGYFRKNGTEDQVPAEMINDQIVTKALSGLDTIEETGKGLLEFVDKFRSLTSVPKPDFSRFNIDDLLHKCKLLMESYLPDNIRIFVEDCPADLTLTADFGQVEQVLINLIRNAGQAFTNRKMGMIRLNSWFTDGGILIQVEDDGIGISKEIIDDIFVPFFTTRENGTGIGLSLSKQIMQNHNGSISVNSEPGKGSRFSLKFPV